MSFEGVRVNKLNGGLGRNEPNTDRVLAVVLQIALANLPAGLAHYTPKKLLQPSDAEALGFTAAYDANQAVLIRNQINKFFRLSPDGELHVIVVPDNLTVTQLCALDAFKVALRQVKNLKGFALALPADVTTTAANVPVVQALVTAFNAERRLFDFVILPARGNAAAMTIADYPDLRTKNSPNVSVSIAQDPAVAALDAAHAKYADWGSVLGMISVRGVSENLGSVDIKKKPDARKGEQDYSLSDGIEWLQSTLSSGVAVDGLSDADIKSLTAKGYIFAGDYDGYGGMFFNSSPTCTAISSDYAYIENNCVWNKAARAIRNTLIPKVKGNVPKNPTTGYIRTTTITDWTGRVNKALEAMQSADEISGFNATIDPKQVLSETSPLVIKATVVSNDIVHSFSVDLGLANSI